MSTYFPLGWKGNAEIKAGLVRTERQEDPLREPLADGALLREPHRLQEGPPASVLWGGT